MTVENKKVPAYTKKSLRDRWSHDLRHNWWLWVMFLPVVVYYAIFSYAPMYGILMAFKDYKVRRGIWGSPGSASSISIASFPVTISGS